MLNLGAHNKKKWNMELIRQLYMSGYEINEITKLEAFEGLSQNYLQKRVYTEKWNHQRAQLRAQAKALGDIAIVDLFKEQTDKHLKFMIRMLEKHRKLIDGRDIRDSTKGQREDIELLKAYEDIARKTLGLDETGTAKDREQMGVAAMISLHVHGPGIVQNPRPAVIPLPDNQNDSTGILDAKNGMSDDTIEAEIVESNEKPSNGDPLEGWDGVIKGKKSG